MVKGSCVCGQSTYEYTGEYMDFVACHCIPCRKVTGADRSLNLVVPKSAVTPAPGSFEKLVSRKGDSGGDLTYYECGNCGNVMLASPEKAPEIAFLKVGLVDDEDFLNGLGRPAKEIYCKRMWAWEKTFEGATVEQS